MFDYIRPRATDLLASITITHVIQQTQVAYCKCDIRNVDDIKQSLDTCESQFGLPNVVINNAAGNFISPTERLSPNAIKTVVDIVLLGTLNITLTIGKRLIEQEQGMYYIDHIFAVR
jgi:2,4-dienoyl-CoA reductase